MCPVGAPLPTPPLVSPEAKRTENLHLPYHLSNRSSVTISDHPPAEMSGKRSRSRDVFVWDLNDNEDRIPLGGLVLTAGVTNTDFRQMLDILITSDDYIVQNEHGDEVLRDDQPLLPGDYFIIADEVKVSLSTSY